MRERLEDVSYDVLELKTLQQQRQIQDLVNNFSTTTESFSQGLLVYLFIPSAASPKTNTLKRRADYIGPSLVTKVLFDNTTYSMT